MLTKIAAAMKIMLAVPIEPIWLNPLIFISVKHMTKQSDEKNTKETNFGIFTGSALSGVINNDVTKSPTKNNVLARF